MSLYVTVGMCRGINYGTRATGDATAWAWWDEAEDERESDRVRANTANGGDETNAHLVVCSKESHTSLWGGDFDPDDPNAPVVDVVEWMRESCYAGHEDDRLREFCDANGLPWREPRWLVVVDQS